MSGLLCGRAIIQNDQTGEFIWPRCVHLLQALSCGLELPPQWQAHLAATMAAKSKTWGEKFQSARRRMKQKVYEFAGRADSSKDSQAFARDDGR